MKFCLNTRMSEVQKNYSMSLILINFNRFLGLPQAKGFLGNSEYFEILLNLTETKIKLRNFLTQDEQLRIKKKQF